MPLAAPFKLGPFLVDAAGGLIPPADREARFSVRWRGCLVQAGLRPAEDGAALQLQAVLGRVPSSAQASPDRRDALLAVLRELVHHPAPLRLGLSADHRVVMRGDSALAAPVTSRGLVAAVTGFVLAVAPYFDLIAESGAAGAGSVNT
jgi:hypothetical protein